MKAAFNMLAVVALSLVNLSVSTNCYMLFYQPKLPDLNHLSTNK